MVRETLRTITVQGKVYRVPDLDCPECGNKLDLKYSGKYKRLFYGCRTWINTGCPGAHGAHPDGRPLGVPANKATKEARMAAHDAFDQLWKSGEMRRKEAYAWMQEAMDMTEDEAHIGRFSIEECGRLMQAIEER